MGADEIKATLDRLHGAASPACEFEVLRIEPLTLGGVPVGLLRKVSRRMAG